MGVNWLKQHLLKPFCWLPGLAISFFRHQKSSSRHALEWLNGQFMQEAVPLKLMCSQTNQQRKRVRVTLKEYRHRHLCPLKADKAFLGTWSWMPGLLITRKVEISLTRALQYWLAELSLLCFAMDSYRTASEAAEIFGPWKTLSLDSWVLGVRSTRI